MLGTQVNQRRNRGRSGSIGVSSSTISKTLRLFSFVVGQGCLGARRLDVGVVGWVKGLLFASVQRLVAANIIINKLS